MRSCLAAVITCLLGIALAAPDARAQDVSWAKRMGGASLDRGFSVALDGDGNAYVTGHFQGTAYFDLYRLTSAGGDDIFVAKLDSGGTVQWAERIGGVGNDYGYSIAVDGDGNGTVNLSEIGRNKATRADRNWRISGHSQTAVDAPEGGNLPKLTVPLPVIELRRAA